MVKEYGCILSDAGEHIKTLKILKNANSFQWGDKQYNVIRRRGDYLYFRTPIFFFYLRKRYYLYNINNPNPFDLRKKVTPVLDTTVYNTMLETKVLKDLNKITSGLFANLNWRVILIGLAIVGVAIYLLQGGKLA